uniref:PIPK domain-containing protein n=1 Tax=Rhabditophanes sp. KR3021 TaxID=114890 RepID=A0AC35TYQ8_9BILA
MNTKCSQTLFQKQCPCIKLLVTNIKRLWQLRSGVDSLSGFDEIENLEAKWCDIFVRFILEHVHCEGNACVSKGDDMIWYVPMTNRVCGGKEGTSVDASHLQVFRKQSKNKPTPGCSEVNWEETVCLNILMQFVDFYVSSAVCTKTHPNNLQIQRKNCQRVYPSPSRRRMDEKGECEEITYPRIYFAIDNFEQVFSDIIVNPNECVCVELLARSRYREKETVIFLGSIRYEILKQTFENKASKGWGWAQKLMNSGKKRHEFVRMRGPHKKGFAEMAVTRIASCGFETPMSEYGYDMRNNYFETDRNSDRRMSDTNLFSRMMTKRNAATPTPASTSTSFFGSLSNRAKRWTSESNNLNNGLEDDSRQMHEDVNNIGSLSKLWSVKGIKQTVDWLQKPEEEMPLNAFLTFVTLEWNHILEDLLSDTPKKPILTFDFDGFYQTPPLG